MTIGANQRREDILVEPGAVDGLRPVDQVVQHGQDLVYALVCARAANVDITPYCLDGVSKSRH